MQVDDPSKVTTGLLLAVAGSIAFSGKAIIVKLAYRHGVDAVTLVMLRMVFALPFFMLMASLYLIMALSKRFSMTRIMRICGWSSLFTSTCSLVTSASLSYRLFRCSFLD